MSSDYAAVVRERDIAIAQAEFWKARWTEALTLAGEACAMSKELGVSWSGPAVPERPES